MNAFTVSRAATTAPDAAKMNLTPVQAKCMPSATPHPEVPPLGIAPTSEIPVTITPTVANANAATAEILPDSSISSAAPVNAPNTVPTTAPDAANFNDSSAAAATILAMGCGRPAFSTIAIVKITPVPIATLFNTDLIWKPSPNNCAVWLCSANSFI